MKPTFGTFGIYRWFLASMVVLSHLGPLEYYCGHRAVRAFFILSGYTITYILDTHYLNIKNGLAKFYLNRALRIYPAYWIVMLLTLALATRFPLIASQFGHVTLPAPPINVGYWIVNICIFGLTSIGGSLSAAVLPVAWSLAIEMTWWLFLPFIIRKPSVMRNFVLSGIGYMILAQLGNLGGAYYSPLGGMLPFSIGMLLYYGRERENNAVVNYTARTGYALALLLLLNLLLPSDLRFTIYFRTLYAGLFLNAVIIYYLSGIDATQISPHLRRIDRILGNLAYPIFLLHSPCSLLAKILFPALQYRSWGLFATGFILSNILAIVLYYGIEHQVNFLRRRVKATA